jgi:ATP adenylyltransferase
MQLGLKENLPTLVARRFTAARDTGHLVFSSTHLSIINAAGISVSDAKTPTTAVLTYKSSTNFGTALRSQRNPQV